MQESHLTEARKYSLTPAIYRFATSRLETHLTIQFKLFRLLKLPQTGKKCSKATQEVATNTKQNATTLISTMERLSLSWKRPLIHSKGLQTMMRSTAIHSAIVTRRTWTANASTLSYRWRNKSTGRHANSIRSSSTSTVLRASRTRSIASTLQSCPTLTLRCTSQLSTKFSKTATCWWPAATLEWEWNSKSMPRAASNRSWRWSLATFEHCTCVAKLTSCALRRPSVLFVTIKEPMTSAMDSRITTSNWPCWNLSYLNSVERSFTQLSSLA